MRNALTLLLIAVGQIILAFLYPSLRWLLLWSGLSFAGVAGAYAWQKPQVFGKRRDGAIALGPCLLLLPYLIFTWLLWFLQTRFSREDVCNEIVPGLWLGRRVSEAELPAGISLVVDLTSEFSEPRAIRIGRSYFCLPTLDNAFPPMEPFREVISRVAGWQDGVYVHCALGHGRSALVVAAVVVARGLAGSPDEALAMVQQARPGVKLNAAQWAFLKRWTLIQPF